MTAGSTHSILARAPLRALLFEDDPEDAELCLRTLRSYGFEVCADVVTTLDDLERQLRMVPYDVILSDYRMPRVTGMDAFRLCQAGGFGVPFILVTGSLGEEKAVECLQQGVSDFVLKDRLARLPSAVARVLEERRLRQERSRVQEALRVSEEQLRQRNQQLEEQNRRVEAASRMKSEFLANMSHELRSPLNGIIGYSEMIYDGKLGTLTQLQKEGLSGILNSSRHLLRIINDVLDLSRIEAGKLEFRCEAVSLSVLVMEACESLAAIAAEKRIRVEQQTTPAVKARVDPARFKQILYNYVSNALKFTNEGGQVTVAVVPEGNDWFRLEVTDTGMGIAEIDQPQLFTNFHQLDSGRNKRFQGTGLGLALTRRIVEAQGGRVGVRSAVGKGSTFFAVLPRNGGEEAGNEGRAHPDCR